MAIVVTLVWHGSRAGPPFVPQSSGLILAACAYPVTAAAFALPVLKTVNSKLRASLNRQ